MLQDFIRKALLFTALLSILSLSTVSAESSNDSQVGCSKSCVALNCDTMNIKYGKYCGVGWTGCPGEKPCDDLDACCKIHDECVEKNGLTDVKCHQKFKKCITKVHKSGKAGFSTICPYDTAVPTMTQGASLSHTVLMDAIREQARRLREQKQAICEQLGIEYRPRSYATEFQQYRELKKLFFFPTSSEKHFQDEITTCVSGYRAYGSKQVELGMELSENSRKYAENSSDDLAKVAMDFGNALAKIEREHADLLSDLFTQVSKPLIEMRGRSGPGWIDSLRLAETCVRAWNEVEAKVVEVSKWEAQVRESDGCSAHVVKLEAAESKLEELRFRLAMLCREATAAMAAVKAQQRVTLQQLRTMLEVNRKYHHTISQIFDQLQAEMGSEHEISDDLNC